MKLTSIYSLLFSTAFLLQPHSAFSQWDKLKEKVQKKAETVLEGAGDGRVSKLISKFEKGQPISTTFDDAIYEADILRNFEPEESQYRPLDVQPKTTNGGGFRLQSGLYSMNAKSFCLRGYTHGPSKGDGHLYAPLKGKKADFVQSILEHYAAKPDIPQKDVQVLLWAIIAGADMNTLGEQHAKTLNALFTPRELLEFQGKDMLNGYADKQIDELKRNLLGNTPPQLQALLDADNKIRTMVKDNKSFQEIEKVAIIAGVAPRDMIREVSKGRWSYHPDGYFVRFFPQGYPQTRIDVFVPFEDAVQTDASGKAISLKDSAKKPKVVDFYPSKMVASPANRPSQRIGHTPVPVEPSGNYELIFYSFNEGTEVPTSKTDPTLKGSFAGHMYIGFAKNGIIESVRGFSPRTPGTMVDDGATVDANTDERYLLGYHTRCFAVEVSKLQYNNMLATTMSGYTVGTNDCVTYVDKIAELLGMVTPTFNPTVFPDSYMEYLQENNPTIGTANHELCNIRPIQQTPIPQNKTTTKTVPKKQTTLQTQPGNTTATTNTITNAGYKLLLGQENSPIEIKLTNNNTSSSKYILNVENTLEHPLVIGRAKIIDANWNNYSGVSWSNWNQPLLPNDKREFVIEYHKGQNAQIIAGTTKHYLLIWTNEANHSIEENPNYKIPIQFSR
ncbi:MAG: hypothetical protein ACKVT2_12505 [Saprospiraceae bacterium]